jgi:hypothetical protein
VEEADSTNGNTGVAELKRLSTVLIVLLVCVAAWLVFFNVSGHKVIESRKAALERRIAQELPQGATPEDVWAFCEREKLLYRRELHDASETPKPPQPPPDAVYATGGRDKVEAEWAAGKTALLVSFYFDEKKRLIGSKVYESPTSL